MVLVRVSRNNFAAGANYSWSVNVVVVLMMAAVFIDAVADRVSSSTPPSTSSFHEPTHPSVSSTRVVGLSTVAAELLSSLEPVTLTTPRRWANSKNADDEDDSMISNETNRQHHEQQTSLSQHWALPGADATTTTTTGGFNNDTSTEFPFSWLLNPSMLLAEEERVDAKTAAPGTTTTGSSTNDTDSGGSSNNNRRPDVPKNAPKQTALGYAVHVIPRMYTQYISAGLFLLFGLKMLWDGFRMKPDEGQAELDEVQADVRRIEEEEKGEGGSGEERQPQQGGQDMTMATIAVETTGGASSSSLSLDSPQPAPGSWMTTTTTTPTTRGPKSRSSNNNNDNSRKLSSSQQISSHVIEEQQAAAPKPCLTEKSGNTDSNSEHQNRSCNYCWTIAASLRGASKRVSRAVPPGCRPFVQGFTMTLLAEWGDRSQISTVVLALTNNVWGVVTGGTLGHAMCTGVAVIGGRLLASKISVKTVTIIGGFVFLVFAVTSLFLTSDWKFVAPWQ
ncbi:unnamed protein product [Notodromas monacha]|uniref:GDT1 family protein n=1 Tax=Notodromas monacha TaxID=399045 RepID=A0A7R9GHW0_9CRUS|nr:unnamed protein product [Notodromas monacha]CAG0923318.1 unnamed protein product [Notodromas monacha]